MWVRELPFDIRDLILRVACAMRLQTRFRMHLLRHTRHSLWRSLRALLLANFSGRTFDLFARSTWVRCEWRTEPDSWLYALRQNPENVRLILAEL
jgi:hypothetical protein